MQWTHLIDNTKTDTIFGEITKIYEEKGQLTFVLREYYEHVSDSHYHAYNVYTTGKKVHIRYEELPKFQPCFFVKNKNGKSYVITHFRM